MTYHKPFKKIDELLEILRTRGLIINDYEFASNFLENVNYYRLSAYFIPFYENKDNFKSKTTFESIYNLYEFDRELREIIFNELAKFEVILRAKIAYTHAKYFGAFGYLKDENALNKTYKRKNDNTKTLYDEFMDKIKIEKSRSNEVFIKHIKTKYNTDDLPIWALSEIISFGTLSRLYSLLPKHLKQEVANSFNVNLDIKVFENWIIVFCMLRNTCAHHARIWNRQFTPSFKYPKKLSNFLNKESKTNQIFFALSIIIMLLKNTEFKDKIFNLFEKYPNIDKAKMGFIDNWQDFTIWRNKNE